jgi:hypothetical protein
MTTSEEANQEQLQMAREQGNALEQGSGEQGRGIPGSQSLPQ